MRREQVMKICLNHVLNKDIEYRPKDEKTWLFHAADYSEGELSRDQFCLRFKTAEVAVEFKKAVDDAVGRSVSAPVAAAGKSEIDGSRSRLDAFDSRVVLPVVGVVGIAALVLYFKRSQT